MLVNLVHNNHTEYQTYKLRRVGRCNLSKTYPPFLGDVTFLLVASVKFCDSILSEIATAKAREVPAVAFR